MLKKDVVFRVDEILKYCKNKSVLHLGYVQHSHLYEELIRRGDWVHGSIASVTGKLTGLDYLKEDVDVIKRLYGYEGFYADAMNLDACELKEKFDVIVCGELIEHLTNPGLMLEGLKRFMGPDSLLIITTPNAWGKEYIRYIRQGKEDQKWINPEHVCWYTKYTLENTLVRHGFQPVSVSYYYSFETKDKYYKVNKGLVGSLKILKRKLMILLTTKLMQQGLFYVGKLNVADK